MSFFINLLSMERIEMERAVNKQNRLVSVKDHQEGLKEELQ